MGKTADWAGEPKAPFGTVENLIQSAIQRKFIDPTEAKLNFETLRQAATSVAESFSDFPPDQGWGTSDTNVAILNMLGAAHWPKCPACTNFALGQARKCYKCETAAKNPA